MSEPFDTIINLRSTPHRCIRSRICTRDKPSIGLRLQVNPITVFYGDARLCLTNYDSLVTPND
jgi:hypothetical protein